ncbi:MAG: hypothetical protein K0Q76_2896 [Panacagrimonas sp.]|jgi:hypothetical protein|nr:DUF3261 domain-containing protein [Panacagrimonas sp.]MCC2657788.1 hypothetical protein [Panacagrimonas sp.]
MRIRAAGGLALAMALTGCAALRPGMPSGPLPPLAPIAPSLPASATQTLLVATGERSLTLQCALEFAPGGWKAACVSITGQRLVTLEVDANGAIRLEGESGPVDGARIAADIQLALWPIELLQEAQRGSAWSTQQASKRTRRLHHERQLVAEVHYAGDDPWNGTLWVSNYRERYSLEILTRRHDAP